MIEKVTLSMEITSYATLALSTISCKIIGIELFGVMQLSFFTLADNDQINLYLTPLLNTRSLNGYNVRISE